MTTISFILIVVFLYNIFMEYERKIVSLYENLAFSGLPVAFVEMKKEAEKVKLCVSLFKEKQGWLFVYLKVKCFCLDLSKKREFIFHDDFFNENEYFFVLKNNQKTLFGKIGTISNMQTKNEKIITKFQELSKQKKYLSSFDKNLIVSSIVLKMFQKEENMFFDQTKRQVQTIFMMNKRYKPLENKIPSSKFVKIGEGDDCGFAGIVYKNNIAFAITIGFKGEIENISLENESAFQFFACEKQPNCGIFLQLRRATDADICFV